MSYLKKVNKGPIKKNFLVLLYGVEGVGKSSFAASTPNPIFLCAEDGTENLDVARLPSPQNWQDVIDMIRELRSTNHGYNTLVVDTLDWLEIILHRSLMKARKVETIQDLGAYGAYVDVVNRPWLELIDELKLLREKMNILMLAHSEVKRFSDPQHNADYDRYELKFHLKKSGSLFKEFVDCLLFANFEVATKEDKTRKTRAYSDGTRVVFTEKRASHDAKNRFSMPYELPLDWTEISKYLNANQNDALKIQLEKIEEYKTNLRDENLNKLVDEEVKKAGNNIAKLSAIASRLYDKVVSQ